MGAICTKPEDIGIVSGHLPTSAPVLFSPAWELLRGSVDDPALPGWSVQVHAPQRSLSDDQCTGVDEVGVPSPEHEQHPLSRKSVEDSSITALNRTDEGVSNKAGCELALVRIGSSCAVP